MKKYTKQIIGFLVGAIAGYAYYAFIGCKTGTCPLTSNPFISTIFGGILGMLIVDSILDLFKSKETA
jgi:LytS/YehU family sensor histidine kinase